jgi:hypothetical protein
MDSWAFAMRILTSWREYFGSFFQWHRKLDVGRNMNSVDKATLLRADRTHALVECLYKARFYEVDHQAWFKHRFTLDIVSSNERRSNIFSIPWARSISLRLECPPHHEQLSRGYMELIEHWKVAVMASIDQ